ncbi:MAG TPA: hypothetical protein VHR72_08890, partial [Gemmataceae bacterium]|nr:hypothetical protein [Gemmataceae bacterium]
IDKLSNEMLATFLRQDIAAEDIAAEAILEEASKRLAENIDDESEIYDGELAIAVEARMERRVRNAP